MTLGRSLTHHSVAPASIVQDIDEIHGLVTAGLTLQSTGGVLTADGTEQTLYIDNEPLGCWKPAVMFVDLDAMLLGDTIVLRAYYRIYDAGGLQLWDSQAFSGIDGSLANGAKIVDINFEPNRHGFQITLQQTAGVNRTFPWEFFAEI